MYTLSFTVNSDIFARVYFRDTSHMRSFVKLKPREMAKLFCHLLMKVNYVIVANFYVANMSFNAIHETIILAKVCKGGSHLRVTWT